MVSTAENHPIHTWITQALRDGNRPYITNLENLIKHFPEYIQPNMEHIDTYIRPPWWKLPAITSISGLNKDKAAEEHERKLRQIPAHDLIIYTDGSGYGGHIGAAIHSPTINVTKGEYIGIDNTHNVYAAELTAIQMAVTLFEGKIQEYSNVYVFTDNQSTIQTIQSPKQQFRQYIIKLILDIIDKIHEAKPACNIHIEWVSGHKDIKGNEQVDQAAKTAATPNTTLPIIRTKSLKIDRFNPWS